MHITKKHTKKQFKGAALSSVAASVLMALGASGAMAAEDSKLKDVEVIEVSGVRSSLENALNAKRESVSIVDAISATDMDALPALDLGEALQALPGIQLNSDDEGRQSTISLRGLSSGFVKTTAFGQSFATPSSSSGTVGSTNPFSAFESGVFDGVSVVKSPTADLQEGGMAGTVDMKLQQALSKKDGTFGVSLGARYEELAESTNPEIKVNGVKHLIKDKLAVAFKFSASKQEFRRDTFDVIDYVSAETAYKMKNGEIERNADGTPKAIYERATNIDEYRAKWIAEGVLSEEDELRVPLRGRNVHQYSDGDRMSLSGNIEYRVNDEIKIGAHILASERKLDNGTKETTNIEAGLHKTNAASDYYMGEITLDMDEAPFAYTDLNADGTGGQAFVVSTYDFQNGKYQIENRKTTFNEKTAGAIFYGEYRGGDWVADTKVTHSRAENNFENIGLNFVHTATNNSKTTPTGFNGTISTGQGDLDKIIVTGTFDTPYVYDGLTWVTGNDTTYAHATASGVTSTDALNDGRRLSANINGRVQDLTKEYSSAEFNVQRFVDFGIGSVLRFEGVKAGARYSRETLDSVDQLQRMAGVDTSNISGSYLSTDEVLSAKQAPFFNGKIPGTFDHTQSKVDPETGELVVTGGWVTIINEDAIEKLQQNIITDRNDIPVPSNLEYGVHETIERNRSGFWDGMNATTDLPSQLGYNFDAEQDVAAVYLSTDISGELPLGVSYTGNLGVRHVKTMNLFHGYKMGKDDTGKPVGILTPLEDDYSNTLPMMNISFELTDDVILRTAYYEGIVRPNLLSQRPSAGLNETDSKITVDLPAATVKPYTADNFDISLEWYNREGSAISLGYFTKTITNLFENETDGSYCPDDGSDSIVNDLVPTGIQRVYTSDTEFSCYEATLYPRYDAEGELIDEVYRSVQIKRTINVDNELKVEGYELAIQQKLDFLPYPWDGLGGVFNYTKIKQSGSENQLNRVSPESFNIIGYYENDGFSARFTYNWRDEQTLQGANSFLGTGIRTREATKRLDFSGSYKVNKKLKLHLQAFNLTDEVGKAYYGYDPRAIHQLSYQGRIYKASVSYKF